MLLESLQGLPVKYSYSVTALFEDDQIDLEGQIEEETSYTLSNGDTVSFRDANGKLLALEDHADTLQVFTLKSIAPALHDKKVVMASPEITPIKLSKHASETEKQRSIEALLGSLNIIQLVLDEDEP